MKNFNYYFNFFQETHTWLFAFPVPYFEVAILNQIIKIEN